LAQTGNDLFYQPGFFHCVICSLSMEDNFLAAACVR
jgi:hypothetical protein